MDEDGVAGGVVPVDFPSAVAARLGSVGGACSWGARRGVQGQAGALTSSAASPPWICNVEISRRLGGGGDLERRVGATALGSGGAPFHSSLSPVALGRGDGAALARREAAAQSGGSRVSYGVFIFVSACFGPAERPWRPRPI